VDHSGIRHSVDVTADSLYEAAALGLRALKRHAWTEGVGPATRLTVEVREPSVQHVVTVDQIRRWAGGVARSPNEKLAKDRVRELLTG
jgi:hypothetical protein